MTEKQQAGNRQRQPVPSSKWGCLSIVGLCLVTSVIGVLLIAASAIGGFGSYYVARYFEFQSTASTIAGSAFGGIAGGIGAIGDHL